MLILRVDSAAGTSTVTIPQGAESLQAFAAIQSVGEEQKAVLSTDLSDTYAKVQNGTSKGTVVFSDWKFDRDDFPVSSGESYLVLFPTKGTALLYFYEAD